MPPTNETLYRPCGLSWRDCQNADCKTPPSARNSLAAIIDVVRRHPDFALGSLATLSIVGAVVAVNANRFLPGQTGGEQSSASSISTKSDQGIQPSDNEVTPILMTDIFIKMAKALLETPGLNMNPKSVVEQMQEEGCSVGDFEFFGSAARMATASEDGLLIRPVPSLDTKQFPHQGTINYGKRVSWIAEVAVENPDKSISVFGLLSDPYRITPVDPDQIPSAPNVFLTEEGPIQIEPAYVRLREIAPDGTVTWFVQQDTPAGNRVLPDGSIDFGNKAYGPTDADREDFNK